MPPAAPADIHSYASLVVRSRLMSPDDVQAAVRRWQDRSKGAPDDVEGFRKFLVAGRQLTEYQAMLVLRGHTEGFFLDSYKILEMIGKGRMAGVYKAIHSSGQVVAIKVLPPSRARDATILGRFQREGRMLTRLEHPNVVRAFQVGESAGKYFLVMENLEGETLEETLQRRKRLSPTEAVRIAYQILMGLQHVHEKGLIHRDVKPANLMLTPGPVPGQPDNTLKATVKILDIGLGRTIFDENARPEEETNLTATGTLLGTPDYLAPEQAQNARAADIRSDIYSVGCVLFHMLTGQVPFPDNNVVRQVLRHATEPARPLSEFLQPVPEGLEQVLNWMIAKNPAQRYPAPERAAQALQVLLMHSPEAAFAPVPSPVHPAFLQWLQAAPAPASAMTTPLPPVSRPTVPVPAIGPGSDPIPVGKLETAPRKAEKARERPADTRPREASKAPPVAVPPVAAPPVAAPLALPVDDFDVELIPLPPPAPVAPPAAEMEERVLLHLDRRDWIMLGLGGAGVLFAIMAGYGIAQLARRSPTTPEEEKKEPKSDA